MSCSFSKFFSEVLNNRDFYRFFCVLSLFAVTRCDLSRVCCCVCAAVCSVVQVWVCRCVQLVTEWLWHEGPFYISAVPWRRSTVLDGVTQSSFTTAGLPLLAKAIIRHDVILHSLQAWSQSLTPLTGKREFADRQHNFFRVASRISGLKAKSSIKPKF